MLIEVCSFCLVEHSVLSDGVCLSELKGLLTYLLTIISTFVVVVVVVVVVVPIWYDDNVDCSNGSID